MNQMRYVKIDGATAIISVDGKFDICTAAIVKGELQTAYRSGCTKIMVDFRQTSYIDSACLRELSFARRYVNPGNFAAKNAVGMVLNVLESANLDSWLIDKRGR